MEVDNIYSKPDRSNYIPNLVKTGNNEVLDIGWNEGFLSDGRPYRAECWAENQVTSLTLFFSTKDMEHYSNPMFQEILATEGLVNFITDERYLSAISIKDNAGSDMWSVNIVIGDEDKQYVKDALNLKPYKKIKV
jgi:hypothetical protein